MATNNILTWAEIGVSGGEVFGSQAKSTVSFDLTIDALKTGGLISKISGIPGLVIPPDVVIPVTVTVAGENPYTITFNGAFDYQGTPFSISGTIEISVYKGTIGSCNYQFQVGNFLPLKTENATAVWVQQPQ
jgi:hypothetical protein